MSSAPHGRPKALRQRPEVSVPDDRASAPVGRNGPSPARPRKLKGGRETSKKQAFGVDARRAASHAMSLRVARNRKRVVQSFTRDGGPRVQWNKISSCRRDHDLFLRASGYVYFDVLLAWGTASDLRLSAFCSRAATAASTLLAPRLVRAHAPEGGLSFARGRSRPLRRSVACG